MESPAEVLALLNRHLYHSTPPEKYATLFLGIYDGERRTFIYSNGGHLPPFVIHESGDVRKLETGGLVIGLFPEIVLEEEEIRLAPGDVFVAFSDGVTEPENEFGEFGEERLLDLLRSNRHLSLERISDIVMAAVQDWIGENEQPDDVTLVLARVR
jgi:sigma-B regulation protein RsbU (phosphoserine phosphatase)